MAYSVATLDQIDELSDGRCPWRPVRHHFGISSFGANAWTGKTAGDRIINEHDEQGENEELYVVLQGRATFELDGERVDAPTGTMVFAEPGVKRTAFAEEDGTTILALGGTPGEAYVVSGWELWAPLHSLYAAGDYEAVIAQGRGPIENSEPMYAQPLYNLACCEALAGHQEDAIDHLRRALELYAPLRELAQSDTDLDSLRGEAGFKELVEVSDRRVN